VTGIRYLPLFEMYGIGNSIWFSAAAFGILALLVYPWHQYKTSAKSPVLRKYTKK